MGEEQPNCHGILHPMDNQLKTSYTFYGLPLKDELYLSFPINNNNNNNRNDVRFAMKKKKRKSIVSISMENINNNRIPSALR